MTKQEIQDVLDKIDDMTRTHKLDADGRIALLLGLIIRILADKLGD